MNNQSKIEIIIQTVDKTTKETKSVSKSLKDLGKDFMKVAGIAAGVGATINKAMDFGKQGAQARVLSAAFQRLGGDLDALRKASRNTVSDFELMNATNTLLIGTSGELQKHLVKQAPRLMEIAKAASTLNPALGDTTFLYESLARGIKRSSPLILDNLGLTIKIGEANEKFADSIGKTVDQLTAEETQLALLQEVMRSGAQLTETAAGIDTGDIDKIERMEASFENLGFALKEWVAPFMAETAAGIELIVTWSSRMKNLQQEAQREIEETAKTYDDYLHKTFEAALATNDLTQIQVSNLMRARENGTLTIDMIQEYIKNVNVLDEAEWNLSHSREEQAERWIAFYNEQKRMQLEAVVLAEERLEAELSLEEVLKRQEDALNDLYSAMSKDWVSAAQDIVEAIGFIQSGGENTVSAVGAAEGAFAATLELGDLSEAERLQGLIAGHVEKIQIAEVKRKQASGEITDYEAFSELREITGDYNEASEIAADNTHDWAGELDNAETALSNIQNYVNWLLGIDEIRVKAIIDINTTGSSLPVGPNGLTPLATGGPLSDLSLVGEQGPELIINGTVIPAHLTKALMGLGVQPGKKYAAGGNLPLIDGIYTPDQIYSMYYAPSKSSGETSTKPTGGTTTTTTTTTSSSTQTASMVASQVSETTGLQVAAMGYQQQANVNQVSLDVAAKIERSNERLGAKMDELIGRVLTEDGAITAFTHALRTG